MYESNSIDNLKREALINRDVDTLKNIKEYDKLRKGRVIYYCLENESVIRDSNGNEISPDQLPFPQDETSLHFLSLDMGKVLKRQLEKPGDLQADISFISKTSHDFTVTIRELPEGTKFPIPNDFNWFEICEQHITKDQPIDHHRRLN